MTASRPLFATVGFYQALAESLNSDPSWLEMASPISYSMIYGYGPPVDKGFFVRFEEGKVTEVCELNSADEREADFVITGNTEHWLAVLQRSLNPNVAMMTGKLKIKGPQSVLVRYMKPFSYLLDKMTELDPVYPEAASTEAPA